MSRTHTPHLKARHGAAATLGDHHSEAAMTAEKYPAAIKSRANGKHRGQDLPTAPISYASMCSHPLEAWFRAAMADHMQSHPVVQRGPCRCRQRQADAQWQADPRFDKDGYLVKTKARLIVRRDQQSQKIIHTHYPWLASGSER